MPPGFIVSDGWQRSSGRWLIGVEGLVEAPTTQLGPDQLLGA